MAACYVSYSVVTVVDLACNATLPAPVQHGSCSNASTQLSNSLFEFNIKARMFILGFFCVLFVYLTPRVVCYGQDKVDSHLHLTHCLSWDNQALKEYG